MILLLSKYYSSKDLTRSVSESNLQMYTYFFQYLKKKVSGKGW
jgi:hypothetical protein